MSRLLPKPPAQTVLAQIAKLEAGLPELKLLWSFDAVSSRAKMAAYLDAGFTREEAFAIFLKDRK
jgi:hypothetical protein